VSPRVRQPLIDAIAGATGTRHVAMAKVAHIPIQPECGCAAAKSVVAAPSADIASITPTRPIS